jgi:micrococcal nuclease
MRRLLAIALVLLPVAAFAGKFQAVVSHITDGDTVWVRPAGGGPPQSVRIEGIDAPEICQSFGPQAREALASRLLHQRVTLITRGEDDYRRTIAHIRVHREDVGRWMVSHGYAWSYRFRRNPGPYAHEEGIARSNRLGLWREASPETPRDFRVRHGSCHR